MGKTKGFVAILVRTIRLSAKIFHLGSQMWHKKTIEESDGKTTQFFEERVKRNNQKVEAIG
jgi:hypothetical protein